jgi:hypothetical protein
VGSLFFFSFLGKYSWVLPQSVFMLTLNVSNCGQLKSLYVQGTEPVRLLGRPVHTSSFMRNVELYKVSKD